MLSVVHLLLWGVFAFQNNPWAHGCICLVLAWIRQLCCNRNGAFAFTTIHEWLLLLPHYCGIRMVWSVASVPQSQFPQLRYVYTWPWLAGPTAEIIIVYIHLTIFLTLCISFWCDVLILCHHYKHLSVCIGFGHGKTCCMGQKWITVWNSSCVHVSSVIANAHQLFLWLQLTLAPSVEHYSCSSYTSEGG